MTENIDKDKDTHISKSNQMLYDGFGGTEKLIAALKSNTRVSTAHFFLTCSSQTGIEASPQDLQARAAK